MDYTHDIVELEAVSKKTRGDEGSFPEFIRAAPPIGLNNRRVVIGVSRARRLYNNG